MTIVAVVITISPSVWQKGFISRSDKLPGGLTNPMTTATGRMWNSPLLDKWWNKN
ncbi:MAG: hypothetical protein IJQ49_03840 [Prevotella sp.]|nr:hypothetical protein [Prevotella sp.]